MTEPCTCAKCPECGGTGDVWISFSGEYLGRFRCDDLDELDVCPLCDGSGILDMCDACREAEEEAREEEWERARSMSGNRS